MRQARRGRPRPKPQARAIPATPADVGDHDLGEPAGGSEQPIGSARQEIRRGTEQPEQDLETRAQGLELSGEGVVPDGSALELEKWQQPPARIEGASRIEIGDRVATGRVEVGEQDVVPAPGEPAGQTHREHGGSRAALASGDADDHCDPPGRRTRSTSPEFAAWATAAASSAASAIVTVSDGSAPGPSE